MSSGLNLWTLLDLVLFTPSKLDFAHRTYWETALLNDILSPGGRNKYDYSVTSLKPPVNVTVGLAIEHLQNLDERYGVMTMHGTLMVSWRDPRLKWNSTLYGGINSVSKTRRYLKAANMEPFIPRLYVTEMYARTSDLLQSEPTRISIRNNGQVIVSVRYQIRTTCHLRYDKYPNDEQNCSITIYTPQPISQVNLIMLGTTKRPPLKTGTKTPIYAGQYQLIVVEPKTLYLLPGSYRIENPKKYPATIVRSVGFLNFMFKRVDVFYTTRMANPVFGLSVLVYLLSLVHSRHVIAWLCFCMVSECLAVSHLVDSLPIDFDTWIMTLTMMNTVFVFCWRVLYMYFEQRPQHKFSLQRMAQVEYYYKFVIPILILYNFYMVYYSFL